MTRLRLGTRGSALARAQAALIAEAIRALDPEMTVELVIIATSGDRLGARAMAPAARGSLEGAPAAITAGAARPLDGTVKALFTKEIEEALLRGEIDAAVHSLKDLPVTETPRLRLAAIPRRADARDVLVTSRGLSRNGQEPDGGLDALTSLPHGARVGTGSLRRDVLLREARADLAIVPIRGNIDTRLRKLERGEVDALVLAAAGLTRLGRADAITALLPPDRFVPAPGQGALAVQVRDGDTAEALLVLLDDEPTRRAVMVERAFAAAVGGGCRLAVGAYAKATGQRMTLHGMVFRGHPLRVRVKAALEQAGGLAQTAVMALDESAPGVESGRGA